MIGNISILTYILYAPIKVQNCLNSVDPFDVVREYRQRRMSGAGQDLFHTRRLLEFTSDVNVYVDN